LLVAGNPVGGFQLRAGNQVCAFLLGNQVNIFLLAADNPIAMEGIYEFLIG